MSSSFQLPHHLTSLSSAPSAQTLSASALLSQPVAGHRPSDDGATGLGRSFLPTAWDEKEKARMVEAVASKYDGATAEAG